MSVYYPIDSALGLVISLRQLSVGLLLFDVIAKYTFNKIFALYTVASVEYASASFTLKPLYKASCAIFYDIR